MDFDALYLERVSTIELLGKKLEMTTNFNCNGF